MAENDEDALDLQPGLQRLTASADGATVGLVVCRRCGQQSNRGEFRCWHCQSYIKGCAPQLVHGLRRRASLDLPAEVREALDEKRAAIASDLGGEDTLSQLQRDVLDRYLDLDGLAAFQAAELSRNGMVTAKGHARALFSAFLQTTDRQVKLAQLLGLERRERQVDSIADYLDRLSHEAGQARPVDAGEAIVEPPDREVLHPAEPATTAADGLNEQET